MSSEALARLTRAAECPARQTVVSTDDLRALLARADGKQAPSSATLTCRRCGHAATVDFQYASTPVQTTTP